MERIMHDISWNSLWRILIFAIFAIVIFEGRQIFLGLFLALVISSGLEVVVSFLERNKIPRTLGVVLVFLVIAIILALLVYLVIPFVVTDVSALFGPNSQLGIWLGQFLGEDAALSFSGAVNDIAGRFFSGDFSPLDVITNVLGGLGLALAAIVSSFYLSLSRNGIERFLRAVLPRNSEERILRIYERSRRKIGYWFQSQIILSLVVGVLVWVSLSILGIKHAFLLGIISALFEIVPFVGPILSGAIAMLFAFVSDPVYAIYVFIIFLMIQQFEAHVLVPILMRKAVDLHPVIIIMSLLLGIELAGILGALIAVPTAAIFQEILDERSRSMRPVDRIN